METCQGWQLQRHVDKCLDGLNTCYYSNPFDKRKSNVIMLQNYLLNKILCICLSHHHGDPLVIQSWMQTLSDPVPDSSTVNKCYPPCAVVVCRARSGVRCGPPFYSRPLKFYFTMYTYMYLRLVYLLSVLNPPGQVPLPYLYYKVTGNQHNHEHRDLRLSNASNTQGAPRVLPMFINEVYHQKLYLYNFFSNLTLLLSINVLMY